MGGTRTRRGSEDIRKKGRKGKQNEGNVAGQWLAVLQPAAGNALVWSVWPLAAQVRESVYSCLYVCKEKEGSTT